MERGKGSHWHSRRRGPQAKHIEGNSRMTKMFVRHQVTDFAKWKKVYDDFDETRQALGVTGQNVYQSTADPADVTVTHDFATTEAAQQFAESEELHKAMAEAGIAGEPSIWFTEPV